MSYRADKLGDGRTDAGNDTTRRPKLAPIKKTQVFWKIIQNGRYTKTTEGLLI